MTTLPDRDAFIATYAEGKPQLVWTTLVADLETPVSAMMKLADGKPNSFLFESVEGGAFRGRYSIIGLKPDLIWRCDGAVAEINREARFDADAFVKDDKPTLDSLRALIEECRIDIPKGLPPMASGLFGYMGYDMVRQMEHLPNDKPKPYDVPDGMFVRPTIIAVFDIIEDTVTLITPARPQEGLSAELAYGQARERLSEVIDDFGRNLPFRRESGLATDTPPEPTSNTTREEFHAMVKKAKDYILAGDAFQVVPSQRFEVPFKLPPIALYRSLRRLNPSPFLFYLDFGGFSIVGSSPEILVRLRDETVTIRPLAGTRKRGETPEQDVALAEELLADPKERAEHLMLLDLGRNDVGRVSQIGTVRVKGQFMIERYSHVMHIASHVEGKIRPELDAVDALAAGFPAGTVSGAPKVRAMEIIDELEKSRRGIYAGAVGYFSGDGAMDTCIALRTSVVKDGVMYVQAGGGVVADSDPESEYQETISKSRALIRAAQEAVRFAAGRG
ncbi:MAG: anthranilate synthase component I [Alphaproteobacteria bacterium]|nr:anthranilate synthase component I [Alphaproteobacteria bacterium]MBU0797772.1 anthranilate synthase component I [Alphaproteobacteria bacterium]MBU0887834.1 anthranilate synthase component I [Alphaproteobacteria bacterium]MBU1814943.1 anthranilate synthase component I [Alphaproteobacteria bacterium]